MARTTSPKVSSKQKKLTEKEFYREYIQKNKKLFKEGNIFSDDVLVNAFGISKPATGLTHKQATKAYGYFNLKKMSVQRKLNELLHQRGLRLSVYNYTQYRVLTHAEVTDNINAIRSQGSGRISGTGTAISRFRAAERNKQDRGYELLNGAINYVTKKGVCKWKKMDDKELAKVKWYYN